MANSVDVVPQRISSHTTMSGWKPRVAPPTDLAIKREPFVKLKYDFAHLSPSSLRCLRMGVPSTRFLMNRMCSRVCSSEWEKIMMWVLGLNAAIHNA